MRHVYNVKDPLNMIVSNVKNKLHLYIMDGAKEEPYVL